MPDPQRVADLVHVGVQVDAVRCDVDDRRVVMPFEWTVSAKAPVPWSRSSNVIWALPDCSTKFTPMMSLHCCSACRATVRPLAVIAVRSTVMVPPCVTSKWCGVATEEAMGQLVRELVQRAHWRRHIVADGKRVRPGAGVAGVRPVVRPGGDIDVIGSAGWRGEDQPRTAPSAAIVILPEDRAAGVAEVNVRIFQGNDVHRNGDLLARGQLKPVPIMVPDHFELISHCRADGDCHTGR